MLKYFFLFVLLLSFSAKAFSKEDSFFSKNLSQREMQKQEQLVSESHDIEYLIMLYRFETGDCKDVIEIEGKAQQEDGESQWILADLYKTGLCVNKNEKEASKWMIKSSDNGFVEAFYDRAIYHRDGIGAEKDLKLAFYWAKKSLTANDERAYQLLSEMYSQGIGTTINYKESLEMALKGAEIGDEKSQAWASAFFASKEFYSPIEAYKWALLANQSNDEHIKKFAQKRIDELNSVLSIKQIQQAQNMAENWKPKTQNLKIKKFQLPKLAKNYSDNITKTQALSELDKLEIGKDRYLFFQAIEEDNLEIFKLFIKAGASIETKSALGFATPLYSSIIFNSKKIFDYLMKNGVQINTELNHNKDTPVLFALSEKRIDMAKQLINAGADLSHPAIMCNAVKYNDVSLLNKLYDLGVKNIDKCDIAISNDALLVKTLCEVEDTDDFCGYEASNIPNIKDNFVANLGIPLINAVSGIDDKNLSKHCFADSTKFLLEKGANPNQLNNEIKDARESILMKAVGSENAQKCVMLLLDHKANINYRDTQGKTALYKAILIGNSQIVKILLQYGANKNDKYYLLKSDIPIRVEKPLSKTVLTSGGTMLMFAVSEGHISVVKQLLESGANPLIETKNGLTALSIAKENKNQILIDLLSEYMKKFSTNNKGK